MEHLKPIIKSCNKGLNFDYSTNPPTLIVKSDFETNLDKIKVTVLYALTFQNYANLGLSYSGNLILEKGTKQKKNNLIIDSVVLDLLYRNLSANNQAGVNVTLRTQIYHELLGTPFNEDTVEIKLGIADIEKALKNKDKPNEDIPWVLKPRVLEPSLSLVVDHIQNKPSLNLSEKITNAIVEAIREDILFSADFQKLAVFEDVVKVTELSGFNLNWAKTASLLSLHEVKLKDWLKNHSVPEKEMIKKEFHQLVEILREYLKNKHVSFEEMDLSEMSSSRDFRNRVLHEGYSPTDGEVEKVIKNTYSLITFLKDKEEKLEINRVGG